MNKTILKISTCILLLFFLACKTRVSVNADMVNTLSAVSNKQYNSKNPFCPEAKLAFFDSILSVSTAYMEVLLSMEFKARTLLESGQEQEAINTLEGLLKEMGGTANDPRRIIALKDLAIAYMRLAERKNCIYHHGMESCVFPIQGTGVHVDRIPSSSAIEIYKELLEYDADDLESRWLLNIAYMTIDGYPTKVPEKWLIKGLGVDTSHLVKPFEDMASNIGLNTKNMAGGSIVDDFNNDGYLDIVTSGWDLKEGMHYCRNNTDGTFTDISDSSGLQSLTGGLNIMQTDYNNDGFKDIFVLRGGWKGLFGKEPNSLLRNNGDGTFTDVTKESGLLSFFPTQTATWNDFNNDGWLDVFIGNESSQMIENMNPCELYLNNKNGTFTNVAVESNTGIVGFIKGVTSGDYDNDGWPDIFISMMDQKKILLKNEGVKSGGLRFTDVTLKAGLGNCRARTFPTWFWDYDNDGWLDLFVCSYEFDKSLAYYAAAEALGMPVGNAAKQYLFRNKHDGTFEDVTTQVGLDKTAFAMGSNFGDIDNDGYSDIYLGTGNPLYQSLVPNKMFKNQGGQKFVDVTSSARVGNLQKGHGVSFADLDNDGDQDIHIDMGGAFKGDIYQNSLFINPGQSNNNWIKLQLEGTKCNRTAIGARIKVTFKENGITRSVYKDVNSGGSFGANPLMQQIGIGSATEIESIEIKWPVSNTVQSFKNLQPGQVLKIKEGNSSIGKVRLDKIDFSVIRGGLISCSPR